MKNRLAILLFTGETFSAATARIHLGRTLYYECMAERFLVTAGTSKSGFAMRKLGQRGEEFIEGQITI